MTDTTPAAPVTATALNLVGEGYRILSAAGLSADIDQVVWDDTDGAAVTVEFEDDTTLSGPGDHVVHAVWHEDASAVTAEQLAAAPSLP